MGNVQKFDAGNIDQVVALHLACFRALVFRSLGTNFMSHYYGSFVNSDSGIGLVYRDGADIAGFVCGALDPARFHRRLFYRRGTGLALASAGRLLRSPALVKRLFLGIFKPRSAASGAHRATLFTLAVSPTRQRQGIGWILLLAFLEAARERGVSQVYVDALADNRQATALYNKAGFKLAHDFLDANGRRVNEYVMELGFSGSPSPGKAAASTGGPGTTFGGTQNATTV